MRGAWKFVVPALLLASFGVRADAPPQVILATPGSAGPNSGAIERFTLRFSAAMIPLGDPRAQPAAASDCPVSSNGRWVDPQTFVIEFDRPLPGGVSCKVTLRDGLATLSGARIQGLTSFPLDATGPSIRSVLAPGEEGSAIDEDQVFLVATNDPPDLASVGAHAACAVEGIGESAAVDVLPRDTVTKLIAGLGDDDWQLQSFLENAGIPSALPADPRARQAALANVLALRCRRPLPPDHDMSLAWPKEIADAHGNLAGRDQRFDFTVRPAFTARFECGRTNGKSDCDPITPTHVRFSAPIDRNVALAVRLRFADGSERSPTAEGKSGDAQIADLDFAGPFPASSTATVVLPANITDLSGRTLSNGSRFPLPVRFDAAPPLVKFAASFGIIEAREGAVLPVTVRSIEPQLAGSLKAVPGHTVKIADDAQIGDWLRKLDDAEDPDFETITRKDGSTYSINHTREKPLLTGGGERLKIGLPGKGKDFEVVGIPLKAKGFYVVELESPALGAALLGRKTPRYVATGALVTDMAVHFKWGHESSLVWVTSLEDAKPVAHAAVRIADSCTGKLIATGQTDNSGLLHVGPILPDPAIYGGCDEYDQHPLIVSARSGDDMSFTLSNWSKGISPYDFELPFGTQDQGDIIHTVFDRMLVRTGETVHFKHVLRHPIGAGFEYAKGVTGKLVFTHLGSDTEFTQDLTIGPNGTGEGEWTVPQGAPLGDYAMRFEVDGRTLASDQQVRVDEYKLPNMRAEITGPKESLVQPSSVPLSLFVGYLSGGGAGQLPVTLRTNFSSWYSPPKAWSRYDFGGEDVEEGTKPLDSNGEAAPEVVPQSQTLPATLGADGSAKADIAVSQKVTQPVSLTVEMDYPDANGETMTASRYLTLYPADLQVGVRTDGWLMRDDDLRLQMVVLGLDGKVLAGKPVSVDVYSREIITARRRLIGGFYAYDNQERVTKLSASCHTTSDRQGLAECKLAPGVSGEVTVVARVKDSEGRESRAVRTVWLAGKDEWWFGGDNGDRMDVIPEQPEYKAGDTARFQVRMPFREATALVTVEREGVLSSFVTHLKGTDPVVEVKLANSYAPNVYVSVMAVRGRVGGFWLWLSDLARKWNLPYFSRDGASPTSTVDLAKPSYRIGMARIDVGWEGHQLAVAVKADRERYTVRDTANVGISVHDPDGKPARSADVAFVAVDEALLQLMPNSSWDLLGSMMGERNLEVVTSTGQMQVVGKRHYGKKAVAAGGGGGGGDASGVNRENFQPVLLWKGHVPLDANGTGHVQVPLSDALSRFRLVAIATDGAQYFGTGESSIRTAQDLSAYPGLPPLVRTGDKYQAVYTLRNGSDHPMTVTAVPSVEPNIIHAPPLTLTIPAGAAGRVRWTVDAPRFPVALKWTLKAQASDGKARDTVVATQEVASAVPVEVWAASLLRVGAPPPAIAPPAGALPGGYVTVGLSDSLAASLDGVRAYMTAYPYDCFEQRLSRIVVNGDTAGWTSLAGALPTYLDGDGLVRYWPDANSQGSPELTAYVLATTATAGLPVPADMRAKMVAGLKGVVEGRIGRDREYSADERLVRIAALSALARAGAAEPGLVARIDMVPADMPTSALADWIVALDRLPAAPHAAQLRAAAEGELRRRLVYEGTRLDLADQARAPWWMMTSGDEMAIKALDAVIGKPGWSAEVPRMMVGVASRQWHGHWDSTPANAWGALVTRRFASAYPASAIAGVTRVGLGPAMYTVGWPRKGDNPPPHLPLIAAPLTLAQTGGTGPWATVTVHAAVPLQQPLMAGYRLERRVSVISARQKGRLSQGDVIRVRLTVTANAERTWVVVNDPLPPGATVLSSLGGQSALLQEGEQSEGSWPAYTESDRAAWRAYYDWLPRGTTVIEYTLRLNSAGTFTLPPARVEAMYSPSIRAQLPIGPMTIWAR
jgi:uncharacterized protein YfaS (alpha-2-macroglobulin family)